MQSHHYFILIWFKNQRKAAFTYHQYQPSMDATNFGEERKKDFYMDPSFINVNHGSFGACPRVVMHAKWQLQKQMEFNTQKWFRFQSQKILTSTRQYVAQRINCPLQNLFFVLNSSDAFNILMKSIVWQKDDTVVLTNTAYTSIQKTINYLQERYSIRVLQVEFCIKDLQKEEYILDKIKQTINNYQFPIRLAVFDHIVSKPAIIMPIQQISKFLKTKNISFFVDAAHSIGQIPIDIQALDVDAYFSNFHKWGFSQKSCAFLYIGNKFINIVRPTITGNYKGEGIDRQFFWTGTRDLTAYLTVKDGLKYLDSLGKQADTYIRDLSQKAGHKMAQIWQTQVLSIDPNLRCYMNNIRVPSKNLQQCLKINKIMLEKYNCFLMLFEFENNVYMRISTQIYNDLKDYQFAANKFLYLLKQSEDGLNCQSKQ